MVVVWLRRRGFLLLTTVAMLIAFCFATWSSSSVFDRLPRTEDEVTFLFQAQSIAEGNIIAPAPEHPDFFYMSFVIARDGQWFGKYPPGYPAVLAAGKLFDQPWVVNALAAAVAAGLLAIVGRRFYDRRTALIASGLLIFSPFFIIQSGSLLSHVVSLCWVLVLLLLFDVARTRDLPLAALGAGAAVGVLLLTRPLTAVGISLPFVVIALVDVVRDRSSFRRYALMAAGALPIIAMLLVYNNATTGSPFRTAYELWWPYDKIGFGPEYGTNGHSVDDAVRNTRSNLRDLAVVLFGWPWRLSLIPVVLAVVAAALRVARRGISRQTTADLLLMGIVVSLIAIHMLYWTSGKMYGPRYYFEAIGALALLSARGLVLIWDVINRLASRLEFPWRFVKLAAPLLLLMFVGYNLFVTLPDEAARYRDWNGVHRDDLEAVEAADLENALVFVPRPNWQAYAPLFLANSTTLDGDVIYAVDRGDQRNLVLMRDFPNRNFFRYKDGQLTSLEAPSGGSFFVDRRWRRSPLRPERVTQIQREAAQCRYSCDAGNCAGVLLDRW